jgi:hypothetical protein
MNFRKGLEMQLADPSIARVVENAPFSLRNPDDVFCHVVDNELCKGV